MGGISCFVPKFVLVGYEYNTHHKLMNQVVYQVPSKHQPDVSTKTKKKKFPSNTCYYISVKADFFL